MQRNGFWKDNRFAKAGAYFGEWIDIDDIFVFAVVEKSLYGCNFALGALWLVFGMKPAYIVFEEISRESDK